VITAWIFAQNIILCFALFGVATLSLWEVKMGKTQTMIILVTLSLLFSFIAGAEDKQTPKAMNIIDSLSRDLEIQLALSALPPHLRENATVYVLNPDRALN
jgi:hypothetical protein